MKSVLSVTIFSVLTAVSVGSSAAPTRGMVAQTINTYNLTSADETRSGSTMNDILQKSGAKVSTFADLGFSEVAVYNVACDSKRSGATTCQFSDLANSKALKASPKAAGKIVELLQNAGAKSQRGAFGFTIAVKKIDCKMTLSTEFINCVVEQNK